MGRKESNQTNIDLIIIISWPDENNFYKIDNVISRAGTINRNYRLIGRYTIEKLLSVWKFKNRLL